MKIILAESGNEFELNNNIFFSPGSTSTNELFKIKQEVERRVKNIKISDQILISATGIQLKESDKKIVENHSTIVVFNRRLLQDHACVERLMQSIPNFTENLVESNTIPNLKELETMIYLYEVEDRDQKLFDTLDHIIQVCVQASNHRHSIIDQFAREINAQSIALNAALNNLESHVRTAHQNIGKFDRIAQREFAKHAIAIASIDLDIELLQNITLHPRVCHISNSIHLDRFNTTLGTFVPLKDLAKCKQSILKKYDELVGATLEQKNKVIYLHQQTSNVSTQRTTSEIVIQRVQNLKQEVDRFTDSVLELTNKIYQELEKRKKRKAAAVKKEMLHLDLNSSPPSPPRSTASAGGAGGELDSSSTLTIRYPLSPPTTIQQRKTKNILRDAIRSIYLHETLIHQAEKSVIEEKKQSLLSFLRCMQSISQVEESVTKIYPRLADLEKDIKLLRHEIERGKGALAKRIIAGYGMLLTELWRRDKYTEIVKGNANLLQNLFGEFGQLEEKYRKGFEKDIICLDKNHILSQDNDQVNTTGAAILPFQMQNIDDPPVICQTSLTTTAASQSEEFVDIVTRREVEEYIQLVHLFYTSNNSILPQKSSSRPSSNNKAEEILSRDVSYILSRNLEREAKRIRSGLFQLGLPGNNNGGNSNNNMLSSIIIAKGSSTPSSPLSPSSTTSTFSDMKLAASSSTPAPTSDIHHLSNMSSTVLFHQQKDWELEKASILRQSQEYRKYIEDLCMKHDQDKSKYEKDKQTLLKKLYHQEKRIEEVKENHAAQIQDFQMQLQIAEKDVKNKEKEWKKKYEATLQTEQEKYDRRLNGFQQRMNAKDQEFAKILEDESIRQTKSAPSSPTSSTFLGTPHSSLSSSGFRSRRFRNQAAPATVSQEQYDRDVQLLKDQIKELVSKHQSELGHMHQKKAQEMEQLSIKLQDEYTAQLKQVADSLQSEHKGRNEEFLTLINSLESEKKTYVEKLAHFDVLKEQMDLDRTKEFNIHQDMIIELKTELEETKEKHRSKILQMNEKFSSSEARLKSLFMNENQQLSMHCEARVENLLAEHQNNMQELKENFENEEKVTQIKHLTLLEAKKKEMIGLVKENKNLIEKVDLTLEQRDKIRIEYAKCKKESGIKLKELVNLQQEQRTAKRIAKDILSVVSSSDEHADPDIQLVDLLRKTLTNVTSLQTRSSIMEQSMDSPYNTMMTMSYGY